MTLKSQRERTLSAPARAAILRQTRCPKTLSKAIYEGRPAPPEADQAIAMAALEVRGLRPWIPPNPEAGALLIVRGSPPKGPSVAVVGARASDPYGLAASALAAKESVLLGRSIVSGGAEGCDAAAHRSTMAEGGQTLVVMASGHDRMYPSSHRELFSEVVRSGGGILSPYWPETPPAKFRFIARNKVIVALSELVIVARAACPSGALTTGRMALAMKRPLLAVPGSLRCALSQGPHQLLEEGALPMLGPHSLRRCLGLAGGPYWPSLNVREASPWVSPSSPKALRESMSPSCLRLLKHLQEVGSSSLEDLLAKGQGGLSDLLGDLLELRIRGLVEEREDGEVALLRPS